MDARPLRAPRPQAPAGHRPAQGLPRRLRWGSAEALAGLVAGLVLLGAPAAGAPAQDPAAAINDVCPVMPEEGLLNDVDIFVEHEGLTVALCCKRCRKEWLKDPEPFVAWLGEHGYLTDAAASGEPAEASAAATELVGVVPASTAPRPTAGAAGPDEVPRPADRGAGTEPELAVPAAGQRLPLSTTPGEGDAPVAAPELPAVTPGEAAPEPAGPEQQDPWLEVAIDRAGRFHPLLVHFPVALLLAALLAQVLGALRGRERYEAAARFCLALGAAGAVVAAALGWAAAASSSYPSAAQQDLFLHRWIGTATAVAAVVAWATGRRAGPLHRSLLVLAAVGVAVAGYYGANLIYGPDHLFGP